MHRLNVVHGHVRVITPVTTSAEAPDVHVFPPNKKHYVTNPSERLARYEGDGTVKGGSKAITVPQAFAQRLQHVGDVRVLAQKRGARDGPWTYWTWKEYYAEVRVAARALMALGCAKHESINILAFNSPEWFFAAIAGIFSGMLTAGIYITNTPDGVEYILDHSKCRVLFVDSDPQLQKALAVRTKCPNLKMIVHWGADCPADGSVEGVMSWERFKGLAADVSEAQLDERLAGMHPDNACYLSYTSGTTGNPKAVMYSHDNIVWSMSRLLAVMEGAAGGFNLEEREISYMPLSHIAGNVQLLGALVMPPTASSLVHFAFPDAMQGSLPVTIQEVRPTHLMGVPRVWEKLSLGLQGILKAKPELKSNPQALRGVLGLEQVRASTTGAAPIAREIQDFFEGIGMPLYEVYGMTENAAYSHFNQKGKRMVGSVGPALTDEGAGAKLATGTNEICTWSRGVMMGYMYMPEKTADTFDDEGFLRTGDIGEVRDGFTMITGRIKEMIITAGGENCAPVLLEEEIKARLPGVSNVVMIGDRQKYLIALITLKLDPNATGGFTNKLAPQALAVDPACTTFEEALKSPIWKQYVDQGIEGANKVAVSRAQHTRKYAILAGDFSPVGETPELTPTMKLRREVFHKKYLDVIKSTYGDDFQSF